MKRCILRRVLEAKMTLYQKAVLDPRFKVKWCVSQGQKGFHPEPPTRSILPYFDVVLTRSKTQPFQVVLNIFLGVFRA